MEFAVDINRPDTPEVVERILGLASEQAAIDWLTEADAWAYDLASGTWQAVDGSGATAAPVPLDEVVTFPAADDPLTAE